MNNPFMLLALGALALLSVLFLTPDSTRLESARAGDTDAHVSRALAAGQALLVEISGCPFELVDTYDDSRTTLTTMDLGTFTLISHVHAVPLSESGLREAGIDEAKLVTVFVTSPDLRKPVTLRLLKTQ